VKKEQFRHTNRKGSSWQFTKVNTIFFCLALAVFGVLSLTLAKPTFSDVEKRDLAAKPTLTAESVFSASFMKDFSAWFADTFPWRDSFISAAHLLESMRGIRPDEIKVYEAKPSTPAVQQESSAVEEEPAPEAEQPAQEVIAPVQEQSEHVPEQNRDHIEVTPPDEDAVGYLMDNGIFVFGSRAVNLFGGNHQAAERYAQTINSYLEEIDPSVQVYNMVVPCSSEFYLPTRYQSSSADQWENISYIYGQLDERVKAVDAYNALAAHAEEYIYFNTDHHWTALGAYYAYEEFCKEAGLVPVPLEEMEARTREGFLGTFYTQTGDPVLAQNPDNLTYYICDTQYENYIRMKDQPDSYTKLDSIWGEMASMTNSYSIFLYGDFPLEKIVTEHKNGRKIVVVKESYGNAFVPFLLSHFEEIYVVDQRYFQTSLIELMEENGVTDLMFLNNVFAANTAYHIDRIDTLKHQTWTPPQTEPVEDDE